MHRCSPFLNILTGLSLSSRVCCAVAAASQSEQCFCYFWAGITLGCQQIGLLSKNTLSECGWNAFLVLIYLGEVCVLQLLMDLCGWSICHNLTADFIDI